MVESFTIAPRAMVTSDGIFNSTRVLSSREVKSSYLALFILNLNIRVKDHHDAITTFRHLRKWYSCLRRRQRHTSGLASRLA
jgi:hypothetical protein